LSSEKGKVQRMSGILKEGGTRLRVVAESQCVFTSSRSGREGYLRPSGEMYRGKRRAATRHLYDQASKGSTRRGGWGDKV